VNHPPVPVRLTQIPQRSHQDLQDEEDDEEEDADGKVTYKTRCKKCTTRQTVCIGTKGRTCDGCAVLKVGCDKSSGGKEKAVATGEKKGKAKAKVPGEYSHASDTPR
jgi:hypothetical protein